jgi:hypothetical protein
LRPASEGGPYTSTKVGAITDLKVGHYKGIERLVPDR